MHDRFTRTSHDKKGFAVLKPFVLIAVFMFLAAGLLIAMEVLGSGTPLVDWSWVFYAVGASVLFVVLALRARSKGGDGDKTDHVDAEEEQAEANEETGEKLDDLRRKIRRRKTDKGS
ncbi:MAG: hypothetical protein RDU20_00710 [Desulfomonilaceae bacterium]|nr:hypothetical protein [Desulfomonilaceae bacterium]